MSMPWRRQRCRRYSILSFARRSSKVIPIALSTQRRQIEASGADVVWLQHEFGLFGGAAGDMIFELDRPRRRAADRHAPHRPCRARRRSAARHAAVDRARQQAGRHVRTFARSASQRLSRDEEQIALIAHGVPDRPFGRASQFKPQFGLAGKQVALTFGLLSPGKGIEAVIEALPTIVKDHPDFLYCIAGATHPNLLAHEGEAYRDRLQALAVSLGVDAHVRWINAFMEPTICSIFSRRPISM
jgi:glycosyltransferase involved in cell wall biosynthesis